MNNLIENIIAQVGQVLLGKDRQVRLALACLFARAFVDRRFARHGKNHPCTMPRQGIGVELRTYPIYQRFIARGYSWGVGI